MQLVPLEFPPTAKLDILRRLDCFHPWTSLDEKRCCRRCGEVISGHQIEIFGGTRGKVALRLQCPTEGCCSVPIEWMLLQSSPEAELLEDTRPTEPELETVEMLVACPGPTWDLGRLFSFLKVPRAIL